MRVCVQANSGKCTQLQKFPMKPPDYSWARENDIFSQWVFLPADYGNIYINTYICMLKKKQSRSPLKWDLTRCQLRSGVKRWKRRGFVCRAALWQNRKGRWAEWCWKAQQQVTVITEHDCSITAVIRHQTKAHKEQNKEEEVEGEGWSSSLLLCHFVMKCLPWSTRKEVRKTTADRNRVSEPRFMETTENVSETLKGSHKHYHPCSFTCFILSGS